MLKYSYLVDVEKLGKGEIGMRDVDVIEEHRMATLLARYQTLAQYGFDEQACGYYYDKAVSVCRKRNEWMRYIIAKRDHNIEQFKELLKADEEYLECLNRMNYESM
jgi:hypothetical protein